MMEFTGERYWPDVDTNSENTYTHVQRYLSITELCAGKRVLDIACGEGYGADIIARTAESVLGVDISAEAIEYAQEKYKHDHLDFQIGTVDSIPAAKKSFDVVVSFETLEHVSADQQLLFMKEIKRVLKKEGVLVISSPDKKNYSDIPDFRNPFHIHELYRDEFENILKSHFKFVKLYDQGIICNSIIFDGTEPDVAGTKILAPYKAEKSRADCNIAVCSDVAGFQLEKTIVQDYSNLYYRCQDLIRSLKKSVGEPGNIIEQKENYICRQRNWISEKDNEIRELKGTIEQKENYIQEQRQWIGEKDDEVRELKGIVEQKENYIQEQRQCIEQKEDHIQKQQQELAELRDIIKKIEKDLAELQTFTGQFPVNQIYRAYRKMKAGES